MHRTHRDIYQETVAAIAAVPDDTSRSSHAAERNGVPWIVVAMHIAMHMTATGGQGVAKAQRRYLDYGTPCTLGILVCVCSTRAIVACSRRTSVGLIRRGRHRLDGIVAITPRCAAFMAGAVIGRDRAVSARPGAARRGLEFELIRALRIFVFWPFLGTSFRGRRWQPAC